MVTGAVTFGYVMTLQYARRTPDQRASTATAPSSPVAADDRVSTANDYFRFASVMLNKGELDGIRLLGRKTVELRTLAYSAVIE